MVTLGSLSLSQSGQKVAVVESNRHKDNIAIAREEFLIFIWIGALVRRVSDNHRVILCGLLRHINFCHHSERGGDDETAKKRGGERGGEGK
jgi:hypothetical protein